MKFLIIFFSIFFVFLSFKSDIKNYLLKEKNSDQLEGDDRRTIEEEEEMIEECDYFLDKNCFQKCVFDCNKTTIHPKFDKSEIYDQPICHKCPYYPSGIVEDPIFDFIEKEHLQFLKNQNDLNDKNDDHPNFGQILDSGTGSKKKKYHFNSYKKLIKKKKIKKLQKNYKKKSF